jgi:hypothetical protein
MEKIMSKHLVTAASAVLAAALATLVQPAEAGFRGGRGFHIGGGHHVHRHHHHRRPIIVTPVYTQRYKVAPKPVIQEKVVVVRYADGMGRVYDLASKVWHDGQNRCWSGKLAWTFRSGTWFYGSYRWYEADGTWRTTASDAPVPVACDTVPAFAGKVTPTVARTDKQKAFAGSPGGGESGGTGAAPKAIVPPTTIAEKEPAKLALPADGNASRASECKRYFPSVGEMLPVPCSL